MAIEIVSVHIPKTGGMSFLEVLQQVYGGQAVFLDNGEYASLEAGAIPLEPWHRVVHGHFWAGQYRYLVPRGRLITWLRHPVNWLISLHRFLDTLPANENPAWVLLKTKQPSLLEFAASEAVQLQAPHRFLAQVPLQDFFFVGLQEHFEDELLCLGRMLGWPRVEAPRVNVNPASAELLAEVWDDQTLANGICDRLGADMKLYEAAEARREGRDREFAGARRGDP